MLHWNVYFKSNQHHKVVEKLCRKIKVEPKNCEFEISGFRDKLSFCKFEVELDSINWGESLVEALHIANRISPHWQMTLAQPTRIICTTQECYIESVESVSWDLQEATQVAKKC